MEAFATNAAAREHLLEHPALARILLEPEMVRW